MFRRYSYSVAFLSLTALTLSGCGNLVSGAHSYSFNVGYENGKSPIVAQENATGGKDAAFNMCATIYQMSTAGTPNDGIDWSSVNSDEFLDGCMAAAGYELIKK